MILSDRHQLGYCIITGGVVWLSNGLSFASADAAFIVYHAFLLGYLIVANARVVVALAKSFGGCKADISGTFSPGYSVTVSLVGSGTRVRLDVIHDTSVARAHGVSCSLGTDQFRRRLVPAAARDIIGLDRWLVFGDADGLLFCCFLRVVLVGRGGFLNPVVDLRSTGISYLAAGGFTRVYAALQVVFWAWTCEILVCHLQDVWIGHCLPFLCEVVRVKAGEVV